MDHTVISTKTVHGETRIIAGDRRRPWRRLGNKIEQVQFYYSRLAHFCIFVFMKRIILSALCISTLAFANVTTNIEPSEMASQVIAEANYEFRNDGIPWNREFDSDRMVRHQTFEVSGRSLTKALWDISPTSSHRIFTCTQISVFGCQSTQTLTMVAASQERTYAKAMLMC